MTSRFVVWLGVVVTLAALLFLRIPLDGRRHFSFAFDGRSPWLGTFLPGQRATSIGLQPEGWIGQRILQDPVYASARVPGVFDRLDTALEIRPNQQPFIEMGLRRESLEETFEMQPVWSQVLSHGWKPAQGCGHQGFVREGEPDSVLCEKNFEQMLTWFASSSAPEWMDTSSVTKTFDLSLRGSHEIYAIPVNGEILFDLTFQDMNRRPGTDAATFRVSKDGVLLWSDVVNTGDGQNGKPSVMFQKRVHLTGLGPGVYQFSISAPDDIFFRQISTPVRHWVIGPRLSFGDQIGFQSGVMSGRVWTNSRHLSLETLHREGLQTVSLGSARTTLVHTHELSYLDRLPREMAGATIVSAPQGDVRVVGDGFFAFDPDALFLPKPRRFTDSTDPIAEGIRVVLTPYQGAEPLDEGWVKIHAHFPMSASQGTVTLAISAPGLAGRHASVDVRHVELWYERFDITLRGWLNALRREVGLARLSL